MFSYGHLGISFNLAIREVPLVHMLEVEPVGHKDTQFDKRGEGHKRDDKVSIIYEQNTLYDAHYQYKGCNRLA